jgi:hypothetical protein
MKHMMHTTPFTIFLISIIFPGGINNAKSHTQHVTQEKIGQGYYLKACGSCHGSGKMGGNMATQVEWRELLDKNAKELIELHKDENGTRKIIGYLKSDRFTKEHGHLLKFLQEFANDSESIPTCY